MSQHRDDWDRGLSLSYWQRPLVQRLGIGIAALVLVQRSQIVQGGRDLGIVGTEDFLYNCQRPLEQRFRIG